MASQYDLNKKQFLRSIAADFVEGFTSALTSALDQGLQPPIRCTLRSADGAALVLLVGFDLDLSIAPDSVEARHRWRAKFPMELTFTDGDLQQAFTVALVTATKVRKKGKVRATEGKKRLDQRKAQRERERQRKWMALA